MAFAHHDAPERNQRRSRKADLLCTQQSRNHHIPARLDSTISLQNYPAAQIIHHQCLMGLGNAQFPWQTRMLNTGQRRRTGAAAISRDQNVIGMRFGHPGSDSSHTHFRYQFDANPGPRVGIFQVINQLRKIFDRVNIMVRRWTDQADAGC